MRSSAVLFSVLLLLNAGCKLRDDDSRLKDIPYTESFGLCKLPYVCVENRMAGQLVYEEKGIDEASCKKMLGEMLKELPNDISCRNLKSFIEEAKFEIVIKEGTKMTCESGLGEKICNQIEETTQIAKKVCKDQKQCDDDLLRYSLSNEELDQLILEGLEKGFLVSSELGDVSANATKTLCDVLGPRNEAIRAEAKTLANIKARDAAFLKVTLKGIQEKSRKDGFRSVQSCNAG